MIQQLAGKTIAVSGASGMAAAGARLFAAEGARVLIVSRGEAECSQLAGELVAAGGECLGLVVDLTDGDATESAFAEGRQQLGRIDGLLGVAGGSGRALGDGPLHEMSTEGWKGTHDLNGLPAFHAARAAVRSMLAEPGPGSIVLVSSVLAIAPSPRLFATHGYAAVKGGVLSLVRAAASYYATDRIRFNCLAPGLVDTPMAARAAADAETVEYARRKQPLAGGFLDPMDVATAALFLLSDQSRMITGQVITVDGGWSVTEVD